MADLSIDILGTSITISTDEEKEYLKTLLEKYRVTVEKVRRMSGLKEPLKIAVLTGFLLCDDLEKAGAGGVRDKTEQGSEAEQLTLGMISRLDEALGVPAGIEKREDTQEKTPAEGKPGAFYKLRNTVKNYEWGSPEWIPTLLGEKNLSRVPWAELWMGVNPSGPSRIILPPLKSAAGDGEILLSDFIDREARTAPEDITQGAKLPYLFKVLAAAMPLSIQAHPNREQARQGYERENREGIPLDAPDRSYKDPNHKPEIICALSPFAALCGFRNAGQIKNLIGALCGYSQGTLKDSLENLFNALGNEENPYRSFLAALFSLETETLVALGAFIKSRRALFERDFPDYRDEWELCSYLAGLYPGDPGVLAPLYLNIIELAPGEAIYLPAGIFHAYIHGMGMELMADSDNVLRGGLTPKHIDTPELFSVLIFSEFKPEILRAPVPALSWFSYPTPAEEFRLSVIRGTGGVLSWSEPGPSIIILTEGSAVVSETETGDELALIKGESIFIPAGTNRNIRFSGTFSAYAAAPGKIP